MCQKLLEEKGFAYLVALLNKEKEFELLKRIEEYIWKKAQTKRVPIPQLCRELKIKCSFLPSSRLPLIYAYSNGKISITPLGKCLKTLYDKLKENRIEGYFFLVGGGAKEAVGLKPAKKSRIPQHGNLTAEECFPPSGPPKIDCDIMVVTKNTNVNEKKIADLFPQEKPANPLKDAVIRSYPDPSFARIDIGRTKGNQVFDERHWSILWDSFGHIAFPRFLDNQSASVAFISNMMGHEESYPYILLTCLPSGEFVGTSINFFPRQKNYKEVLYQKSFKHEPSKYFSLKPTIIYWPEIAFPAKESPSEALTRLIHLLRSVTWEDQLPLIYFRKELSRILEKRFQKRLEQIKKVSLQTSQYWANHVIYPVAVNTNLIANEPISMRKSAQRLIKAIKHMLNGNPYLGTIYLLAAGENPTDAPVYGTGIIDPKGFFPELYEFLHQGDRLERLIRLMAETEEGPATKGWLAFLNFIYSETGFDVKETAKLLNPNFCSMKIYPTLAEDFFLPDLQKPTLPFESLSEAPLAST